MTVTRHASTHSTGLAGSAGATIYAPVGCTLLGSSTTEASRQLQWEEAGSFGNLRAKILTNAAAAGSTIALRKAGVDTAAAVTIGAGATGVFTDSDSVSIAAGDLVSYGIANGTGGNLAILYVSVDFTPTASKATTALVCTGTGNLTTASTTRYMPIAGRGGLANATEAFDQLTARAAGTLRNLFVRISANARTSTTYRLRKNTANGSMNVVVGASATGYFEDTTNTDAVAAGDVLDYSVTTGTGTATLTHEMMGSFFDATSAQDRPHVAANGSGLSNTTASVTRYTRVEGDLNSFGSTEADVQDTVQNCVMSRLMVRVSANTRTATTVTLRKNGADTAVTLSIGASSTGLFEDTTNSAQFFDDDLASIGWTFGTGTNTLTAYATAVTAALPVRVSSSDSGSGAEGTPAVALSDSGTGSGADAGAPGTTLSSSDVGSGADVDARTLVNGIARLGIGSGSDDRISPNIVNSNACGLLHLSDGTAVMLWWDDVAAALKLAYSADRDTWGSIDDNVTGFYDPNGAGTMPYVNLVVDASDNLYVVGTDDASTGVSRIKAYTKGSGYTWTGQTALSDSTGYAAGIITNRYGAYWCNTGGGTNSAGHIIAFLGFLVGTAGAYVIFDAGAALAGSGTPVTARGQAPTCFSVINTSQKADVSPDGLGATSGLTVRNSSGTTVLQVGKWAVDSTGALSTDANVDTTFSSGALTTATKVRLVRYASDRWAVFYRSSSTSNHWMCARYSSTARLTAGVDCGTPTGLDLVADTAMWDVMNDPSTSDQALLLVPSVASTMVTIEYLAISLASGVSWGGAVSTDTKSAHSSGNVSFRCVRQPVSASYADWQSFQIVPVTSYALYADALVLAVAPTPVSSSDSGSGAEGTPAVAFADAGTGSGAEGTPSIRLSTTETSTGADGQSVTAPTSAAETGSGAEGTPGVRLADSGTGSGADAGTLAAATSSSDTGAGAEGATPSIRLSTTETTTGADGQSVTTATSAAETGSGVEGTPGVALSSAETGAGADAGTSIRTSAADTGSGADSGTASAATSSSDTGSGADAGTSIRLSNTEASTGADAATIAASATTADAGSGAEGTPGVAFSDGGTGSGADAGTVAATPTSTDTGSGVEGSPSIAAATSGQDTGTGAEGSPAVALAAAETGSGADSQAISSPVASSDTGSGAEGAAPTIGVTTPDAATGGDASTIAASATTADAGSGADTSTSVRLAHVDTGSSSDSEAVSSPVASSDTASGADTASPTIATATSDQATTSDAGTLAAATSSAEVGAGADAGTSIRLGGGETGSGADQGQPSASFGGSDSGSGADSETTSANVTSNDAGSALDAAALAAVLAVADGGSALDAAILSVEVLSVDVGSGVDVGVVVVVGLDEGGTAVVGVRVRTTAAGARLLLAATGARSDGPGSGARSDGPRSGARPAAGTTVGAREEP